MDEAVRGQIGRWYLDAIDDAGIKPVGDPQLDIGDLPAQGQPLTFSIEIGVRPTATLGTYKGVEVGARGPRPTRRPSRASSTRCASAPPASRPSRSRRARRTSSSWTTAARSTASRSRAARRATSSSSSAPAGSSPGFEEQLTGAKAGDQRTVKITFPDDYGADELKGREAEFEVTVNEVKRKELPEARRRLRLRRGRLRHPRRAARGRRVQAPRGGREPPLEAEFREAVLDAVVAECEDRGARRARPRAPAKPSDRIIHSLGHQGITRERLPPDRRQGARTRSSPRREPDAEQALRREAVLAAVDRGRGHRGRPTSDIARRARRPTAAREAHHAEKLLRAPGEGRAASTSSRGTSPSARRSTSAGRERAGRSPSEQARARDKLWTPDKEYSAGDRKADLDALVRDVPRGSRAHCPHTADSGKRW